MCAARCRPITTSCVVGKREGKQVPHGLSDVSEAGPEELSVYSAGYPKV